MILNILLVILLVTSCLQVKYISLIHENLSLKLTRYELRNQLK